MDRIETFHELKAAPAAPAADLADDGVDRVAKPITFRPEAAHPFDR
ncbi:hypothetical protein [Nonomuraea sp. NPDC049129]